LNGLGVVVFLVIVFFVLGVFPVLVELVAALVVFVAASVVVSSSAATHCQILKRLFDTWNILC